MGIDRDPPVWPSIQDDGGYQSASSLWIVDCGVGAVTKWSSGVNARCGNMSVSQHFSWPCSCFGRSPCGGLSLMMSRLPFSLCLFHPSTLHTFACRLFFSLCFLFHSFCSGLSKSSRSEGVRLARVFRLHLSHGDQLILLLLSSFVFTPPPWSSCSSHPTE